MLRVGMFLGNRYEIIGKIGSGGMSEVYKAKCHKLNRNVAIKVLKSDFSSDHNFLAKFRMEAQSAACLSHPNIVSVFDVGEDRGIYYIVMELIEGITLKKYIERKKKLEIRESIEVAMQVARGLEAAHAQRIVHRDIKPQNIMVSREGKVKVTDFGIARASASQTISSNTMGSVHYISPEQARGGYCDERSDIYSLGITLYEMLTGRVPFEGDSTVAVALLHIQGEMVPPRQYEPLIPVSLEKIILKCTQKKPELRYSSATELIDDLKRSLMIPNEDFVRINSLTTNNPTMIFSGVEKEQIRRQSDSYEDEEDYYDDPRDTRYVEDREDWNSRRDSRRGGRDDHGRRYERDYDDDYDDYDESDARRSRVEKIVTGISIVVAILIVVILSVILLKGCGSDIGAPATTTSSTERESTTEATTEATTAVPKVEMENLLGMTQNVAIRRLTALGLEYKVEEGTSEEYPEGQVFEQEYREGEMLEPGTVVTIKVSIGPGEVTIPESLRGKTIEDATEVLEGLGLKVASRTQEEFSDDVKEGRVMGTDPELGTSVKAGSTVTLIISAGPEVKEVKVPDITGLTESGAIARLEEYGLRAGSVTPAPSDKVAAGRVISQGTKAGTKVKENTAIDFVVSEGSDKVTVPDVRYSTLNEANKALTEIGLSIGDVTEEYSDSSTKGLVIRQSVKPGKSVKKGTSIDVVISLGEKPAEAQPTHDNPGEGADGGDPDEN